MFFKPSFYAAALVSLMAFANAASADTSTPSPTTPTSEADHPPATGQLFPPGGLTNNDPTQPCPTGTALVWKGSEAVGGAIQCAYPSPPTPTAVPVYLQMISWDETMDDATYTGIQATTDAYNTKMNKAINDWPQNKGLDASTLQPEMDACDVYTETGGIGSNTTNNQSVQGKLPTKTSNDSNALNTCAAMLCYEVTGGHYAIFTQFNGTCAENATNCGVVNRPPGFSANWSCAYGG
jgi:hypothetical protein